MQATALTADAQAKAKELVAPYEGRPGAFPITERLSSPVPPGTRIAYIDNGNALVSPIFRLMQPAAKELGVDLYAVRAGTSASGVQAAFSTVVQQRPDAVINTAIDPALWDNQRKQLIDEGIPVVSLGTVAPASSGLVQPNGAAAFERQGRLQAAWLVANNDKSVEAVLYEHNELAYAAAVKKGFESEYLKDKQGTVELGADLNTLAWTAVDTAARLIIGQKLQPRTWSRVMLWCTSSSVRRTSPSTPPAGSRRTRTLPTVDTLETMTRFERRRHAARSIDTARQTSGGAVSNGDGALSSRDLILNTASNLISSHGYDGMVIRDLSERSGLPPSSIYYHFGNKLGVLVALLERTFEDLHASFPSASSFDDRSPLERFERWFTAACAALDQRPEYLRLLLAVGIGSHAEADTVRETVCRIRDYAHASWLEALTPVFAPVDSPEDRELVERLAVLGRAMTDGLSVTTSFDGTTYVSHVPAVVALVRGFAEDRARARQAR